MSPPVVARPPATGPLAARLARIGQGFVLGGVPVFAIWLVEPLPADPYQALDLAPSSVASFVVPGAIAALAGLRLGAAAVAGVVIGAAIGFPLAGAFAAPVYHPHPWDELDGVWAMWYWAAGWRTVATSALVGLVAWLLARALRVLGRSHPSRL